MTTQKIFRNYGAWTRFTTTVRSQFSARVTVHVYAFCKYPQVSYKPWRFLTSLDEDAAIYF